MDPSPTSPGRGATDPHSLIGDDRSDVKCATSRVDEQPDVRVAILEGRVFCMGDACHRHPPNNGLGSNTSIQDSYNLAWKLAHVLRGEADPSLLDTYGRSARRSAADRHPGQPVHR